MILEKIVSTSKKYALDTVPRSICCIFRGLKKCQQIERLFRGRKVSNAVNKSNVNILNDGLYLAFDSLRYLCSENFMPKFSEFLI